MEIIDNKANKTDFPKNYINRIRVLRFGKIFSNLTFFSTILSALIGLATLLMPLFYSIAIIFALFLGLLIALFTLGIVFFIENNIVLKLWNFAVDSNNGESLSRLVEISKTIIPYISFVSVLLSVLSIIFLSISKQKGLTTRIVFASICLVVCAILGGLML